MVHFSLRNSHKKWLRKIIRQILKHLLQNPSQLLFERSSFGLCEWNMALVEKVLASMEVRKVESSMAFRQYSLLQTTQKQSEENRQESGGKFRFGVSPSLEILEWRIQSLERTRGKRSAFQSPARSVVLLCSCVRVASANYIYSIRTPTFRITLLQCML